MPTLKTTFLLLPMVLLANVVHAGSMSDTPITPSYFKLPDFLTASFDFNWAKPKQNQTLELQQGLSNLYDSTSNTQAPVGGEVFICWQKPIHNQVMGEAGFQVMFTNNARISGDILQDADPDLNNLTYAYKINHTDISFKAKLVSTMPVLVQPYALGSIGVGFNRSNSFGNQPKIPTVLPSANFASKTVTALTYTLGAGVQKAMDKHWKLGVGYEFQDWGKSELGRAPGQTLNQGPSLTHLYVNTVQISAIYG